MSCAVEGTVSRTRGGFGRPSCLVCRGHRGQQGRRLSQGPESGAFSHVFLPDWGDAKLLGKQPDTHLGHLRVPIFAIAFFARARTRGDERNARSLRYFLVCLSVCLGCLFVRVPAAECLRVAPLCRPASRSWDAVSLVPQPFLLGECRSGALASRRHNASGIAKPLRGPCLEQ